MPTMSKMEPQPPISMFIWQECLVLLWETTHTHTHTQAYTNDMHIHNPKLKILCPNICYLKIMTECLNCLQIFILYGNVQVLLPGPYSAWP
jgi:hypothetical protein